MSEVNPRTLLQAAGLRQKPGEPVPGARSCAGAQERAQRQRLQAAGRVPRSGPIVLPKVLRAASLGRFGKGRPS